MATTTETDVKSFIGEISGLRGPFDNGTTLGALNFTDDECSDLAEELDKYVKAKKPGIGVADSEITTDMSIQDIIDLVNQKLGL